MDDLISRQAAIDALDKRFDSIPMEQTTEILLLRKDLRNLPSAQPEQRWIPCSERLPEDGQRCIVTTKGRLSYSYCEIASYSNNLYKVDEFDFYDKKNTSGFYNYDSEYGYYENTDVIAWMPLPEPWRGDSICK